MKKIAAIVLSAGVLCAMALPAEAASRVRINTYTDPGTFVYVYKDRACQQALTTKKITRNTSYSRSDGEIGSVRTGQKGWGLNIRNVQTGRADLPIPRPGAYTCFNLRAHGGKFDVYTIQVYTN